MPAITVLAVIFTFLAAAIQIYTFVLESIAWKGPRAMALFGNTTEADAEATKEMAFNLGFYNLFLGVLDILGAAFLIAGNPAVGYTLAFAGLISTFAAALVLFCSNPGRRTLALKQAAVPLIALILMTVSACWFNVVLMVVA